MERTVEGLLLVWLSDRHLASLVEDPLFHVLALIVVASLLMLFRQRFCIAHVPPR